MPMSVNEPVVLRAGLGSLFVPMETGGVGSDPGAGSSFSRCDSTILRKFAGTEHGSSRSARSSKLS